MSCRSHTTGYEAARRLGSGRHVAVYGCFSAGVHGLEVCQSWTFNWAKLDFAMVSDVDHLYKGIKIWITLAH